MISNLLHYPKCLELNHLQDLQLEEKVVELEPWDIHTSIDSQRYILDCILHLERFLKRW